MDVASFNSLVHFLELTATWPVVDSFCHWSLWWSIAENMTLKNLVFIELKWFGIWAHHCFMDDILWDAGVLSLNTLKSHVALVFFLDDLTIIATSTDLSNVWASLELKTEAWHHLEFFG